MGLKCRSGWHRHTNTHNQSIFKVYTKVQKHNSGVSKQEINLVANACTPRFSHWTRCNFIADHNKSLIG